MNAKSWRLYGASDLRLEDVELGPAGEDGVVVEIVANSVCVSDYKCVTLGAVDWDETVPGPILLQGDHSNASFKNMILTKIVK